MAIPTDGGASAAPSNSFRGRIVSRGTSPASVANIANIITVIRIFLAPLFIWMLLTDDGQMGALRWAAAALFIVAIATDSLDGHLARGRNLITNVGIILDPIADKVLIGGALVTLSILGELWWWVTIVIMVRELGITAFRFAVLSKSVIPASKGGKLKTVIQSVAIALYLVPLAGILGDWMLVVNAVAMGAALVLTVYTGIDYLVQARRVNRKLA